MQDDKRVELHEIQIDAFKELKKDLNEALGEIDKNLQELKEHSVLNARKIDKLTIELNSLTKQIKNIDDKIDDVKKGVINNKTIIDENKSIKVADKMYNDVVNDIEELKKQKEDLEQIKDSKNSFIIKKMYSKKIDKMDKYIEKLRTKKSRIEQDQKSMLISKAIINNKKNKKQTDLEAKKEYFEMLNKENEESKKDLLNNNNIFSKIEGKIFDIRGKKYQKNIKKAEEKLNKLNNKNTLKSANVLNMSKEALNKIRQKIQYSPSLITK